MKPIRAQPGHVFAVATQTAACQPISGQSDFLRTACDDGAKQQQRRFHETLSSVINHGSPSKPPAPVRNIRQALIKAAVKQREAVV